MQRLLL